MGRFDLASRAVARREIRRATPANRRRDRSIPNANRYSRTTCATSTPVAPRPRPLEPLGHDTTVCMSWTNARAPGLGPIARSGPFDRVGPRLGHQIDPCARMPFHAASQFAFCARFRVMHGNNFWAPPRNCHRLHLVLSQLIEGAQLISRPAIALLNWSRVQNTILPSKPEVVNSAAVPAYELLKYCKLQTIF